MILFLCMPVHGLNAGVFFLAGYRVFEGECPVSLF